MKALLVTGGFIDDRFTLDYIEKEKYDITFAIDRGLEFFARTGLVPDYIVGDFDSVADEVLEQYASVSLEQALAVEETFCERKRDDEVKDCEGKCAEKADDFCERKRENEIKDYESECAEKENVGCEKSKNKDRTPEMIRLTPMKDDTDTQHALQMALDKGCDCIHIFGATGTRLDHVLGNMQLLGYALRQNAECVMIDPYNRIRLLNKEIVLKKEHQFGKYVSLIPYTPEVTGITLEGFLYPLKDYTMSSFYQEHATLISGVSNEIVDEKAKIFLESGILVLVEARD